MSIPMTKLTKLPPHGDDPYLAARQEYSDRYANLAAGKRNWQLAALGFFLLAATTSASSIIQLRQVKQIPYLVQEDPAGEIVTIVPQLSPASSPISMQRIEIAAVDQFIRDSRTAIADFAGEDTLLRWVKAHAAGPANRFLASYFEDGVHNPHIVARRHSVAVTITSDVPIGPHSFQVRFVEQYLDHNGALVEGMPDGHFVALVHTEMHSLPDGPTDNPFDIKVIGLQWAPENLPAEVTQ
jgi:type IV secretion system protein TrbF